MPTRTTIAGDVPTTKKRILITGAAGFIGCHLARALANGENEVVLLDDYSRGKDDDEFKALVKRPGVLFEDQNCGFLKWIQPADEIYHLAAVNGTDRFYETPAQVLVNNLDSTIQALEYARKSRLTRVRFKEGGHIDRTTRATRILFTSSNEAYAGAVAKFGSAIVPTAEDVPLVIDDPSNPRWSYGGSKLAGELLVHAYAKQYGIPAVIVRPHNFYGPRAGTEHVIPQMIQRAVDKEDPFRVPGSNETRSFCYIDDAVTALIGAMAKASADPVPTYHIGTSDEISMWDLADKILAVVGHTPDHGKLAAAGRVGSVARRCPDIAKIGREIGWRPTTSLDAGLAATFAWYHDRRDH